MADSTVAALTASDALTGPELFYADGFASAVAADVKVTATQIKTWAVSGLTITPTTGTFTLTNAKTFSVTGTLTLAGTDGKTLTVSNSLTLAGTDGSTLNIGAGGALGTNAFTSTAYLPLAGGTLSGPLLLSTGSTTNKPIQFTSGTLLTSPVAGTIEFLTDAYYGTISTGPARKTFAFLESPSFTTPGIGVATGTSLALGGATINANVLAAASGGTDLLLVGTPTNGVYLRYITLENGINFYTTAAQAKSGGVTGRTTYIDPTRIGTTGVFGFTAGDAGGALDLILQRDAANTIALRNGTAAQTCNHYDTWASATDYHRLATKTARATLSGVTGASVTATGLIPDGAVVVGVTTKVTTGLGITGGTTGYAVGTGADPNRWGDIVGTAAGTSSDNRDWTSGLIDASIGATDIILTAAGGNFDGTGVIYVSVQYLIGQCD